MVTYMRINYYKAKRVTWTFLNITCLCDTFRPRTFFATKFCKYLLFSNVFSNSCATGFRALSDIPFSPFAINYIVMNKFKVIYGNHILWITMRHYSLGFEQILNPTWTLLNIALFCHVRWSRTFWSSMGGFWFYFPCINLSTTSTSFTTFTSLPFVPLAINCFILI